jgi:ethanolamine ammonia-lyase large subunit
MDEGHLETFLPALYENINALNLTIAENPIVIKNGRVRVGYQIGEELFGYEASQKHCIIHIIGERPGTMHRNFSVYITTANASTWKNHGKVDHDITRVISGISDTSYQPKEAALEAASLIKEQLN